MIQHSQYVNSAVKMAVFRADDGYVIFSAAGIVLPFLKDKVVRHIFTVGSHTGLEFSSLFYQLFFDSKCLS
jgi:hypothetical protein